MANLNWKLVLTKKVVELTNANAAHSKLLKFESATFLHSRTAACLIQIFRNNQISELLLYLTQEIRQKLQSLQSTTITDT